MSYLDCKEFVYTKNEKSILVKWWSKDFTAYYETEFGTLKYGLHVMYASPKVYTEEMLKQSYIPDIIKYFDEAENFLKAHQNFIAEIKDEYEKRFAEEDEKLEKLREERIEKRNRLKSNELSQKEWSLFCKEYNNAKSDIEYKKSTFVFDYVEGKTSENSNITNIIRDYVNDSINI